MSSPFVPIADEKTLTYEILAEMVSRFKLDFIGYTMRPNSFYRFERENRDKDWLGEQVIPNYRVDNQPCEIVRWTSREVMMRYVRRKDAESQKFMNQKETIFPVQKTTFKFASAARVNSQREITFNERCETVERITEQSHNRRLARKKKMTRKKD